jgi:putative tryptophan/tyrosine transport system substrate-binding protein
MRRRDFMRIIGSAAAAWPLAAHAQPRERMRRIGFMFSSLALDDSEGQARLTAFVQKLQELGWTDGRNIRIDYRSGLGDAGRLRRYAAELVALAPDAILAGGNPALAALQEETRTLPIVFANALDPVGFGQVASLARPGGNATGFMSVEFGLAGKLLELLKEIAPAVKRVAVLRNPGFSMGELGAIQAVAPSFGVELTPVGVRDADEIERGIAAFVRGPTDGLIDLTRAQPQTLRDLIIALAARHRLPAIHAIRRFVIDGGLMSFGNDQAESYRLAAGYVDRILRGEKPGDLPVQAPTKYELVINLKTAKALGLTVPPTLRVSADEVIE